MGWRWWAIAVVAACSGDADYSGDGSYGPTISFGSAESDADETAGTIEIPIYLDPPTDEQVAFVVSVAGGTATNGDDFVGTIGPMLFFPQVQYLPLLLNINADSIPEDAETVEFELTHVVGARVGLGKHTFTIRNNLLPRVSIEYSLDDRYASEGDATESIPLKLWPASSESVTVDFTLGGTATGDDYALRAGTVTFPPGVTTVDVPLDFVDDALDEDSESVVFSLANPVNAILDPIKSVVTEHINDNDAQPDIKFATRTQVVPEGNTGTSLVTIDVSLTAMSGRTVTAPFNTNYSSATSGTDFTLQTASPLVFPPGVTTQTISILVAGDTVQDGSERIVLNIESPTNAYNVLGNHVITLANDECYGDAGFVVCPDDIPTTDLSPSAGGCKSPPMNWVSQGQAANTCFMSGTNVTISGDSFFYGAGPVIIYAVNTLTVTGIANVSGSPDYQPPDGANASQCLPFATTPGPAAGGAGGSFMTAGGNGGAHSSPAGSGGIAAAAGTSVPTALRGGCPGQFGGSVDVLWGGPGNGGGAIYLVAGGQIILQPGSIVNASGGGALAWAGPRGGSGGGSGGMIVLWAPSITATGATVVANGGGGGEGGSSNGSGVGGTTCDGTNPLIAPAGGSGTQGGDGGDGFAQSFSAQPGSSANNNNGAGGGGGGAGYIKTNVPLTGASVSPAPS